MLRAGRHNPSLVLLALFTGWVLSPFIGLVAARRWSLIPRPALNTAMMFVASASVVIYGYVSLGPPRNKIAAVFLMVPLASWALIGIAIAIGKRPLA